MDLDTHCVIFENIGITELKSKIDSELIKMGLNYQYKISTVLESKNQPKPYFIITSDATTFDELNLIHNNFCKLFKSIKVNALIESEHNYDIQKLFEKMFLPENKINGDRSLENFNRKSMSELHWGDIHLDIPINNNTKNIRERFDDLGFSHIITSKNNTQKAVITAQVKNKELLTPILEIISYELKQALFKANSFIIKAEKLIHFDATFKATPLPVTTGVIKNYNICQKNIVNF